MTNSNEEKLRKFVESITDALGPYPELNGTNIVSAANRVLTETRQEKNSNEKDLLKEFELVKTDYGLAESTTDMGELYYYACRFSQQVEALIKERDDMTNNWHCYVGMYKSAKEHVSGLKAKLEAVLREPTEDELAICAKDIYEMGGLDKVHATLCADAVLTAFLKARRGE